MNEIVAQQVQTDERSQPAETEWLTVRKCAALLGVCDKTIYQQIAHRRLRCARIGSGRGAYRIHRSWCREYAEAMAEPVEIRK